LLTSRSSSFEMTDKLEIGRYDLASAGSRSAFFSNGVMLANLNVDETKPLYKDQLNSRHRNRAKTSTDCFSSHVGSGSLVHCLSGNFFTNSTTSADETGVNSRSSQLTGTVVKVGESAPAVDARRTPATLSSKKRCSVEASMSDDTGARPRPTNSSNDRQSRRGRDCLASRRFVQIVGTLLL